MSDPAPRVLMFSQRNIYELEVWRAPLREFENVITSVDAVDVVAPPPGRWFAPRKRLALRVGQDSRLVLNPGIPRIRLEREYDLFFAICEKPSELLNVNAVEGWKDRCRTSVCWLPEVWVKEMPLFKSSFAVLSRFDYVFSHFSQSVAAIARVIGGRCLAALPGVDCDRFVPYPRAAPRSIDVLSIGRRSEPVHAALLRMAQDDGLFYVYDTKSDMHTADLEQHRSLMASLARRSRYFVVNPAKCDSPDERGSQSEMGVRYVEGAAAGAVMIGEAPRNEDFTRAFSWPDAVVPLPPDARRVREAIEDMDRQPERQARVRRTNVVQTLRHHDWVYRWETVLRTAGLDPMPELVKRKERLAHLSHVVEASHEHE